MIELAYYISLTLAIGSTIAGRVAYYSSRWFMKKGHQAFAEGLRLRQEAMTLHLLSLEDNVKTINALRAKRFLEATKDDLVN